MISYKIFKFFLSLVSNDSNPRIIYLQSQHFTPELTRQISLGSKKNNINRAKLTLTMHTLGKLNKTNNFWQLFLGRMYLLYVNASGKLISVNVIFSSFSNIIYKYNIFLFITFLWGDKKLLTSRSSDFSV